jgi:hypothetical protein
MADFSDLGAAGDVLQGHYGAADDRRNGFYIPVLSRARHYDRVSGYFTSAGLAAAAQGLATFLPGGGTMRLIVGAQLNEADVAAISKHEDIDEALASALSGSTALEADLGDVIHQRYREVLTWMFAAGRCEIKVGLKRGPDGLPVAATADPNYFHHKLGVFTDATDAQVAFFGSGNETWSGWVGNSESFSVVASWWGSDWWGAQGAPVVTEIDEMWLGNAGPEWMVVDLPTAVRDRLLKFAPSEMPAPKDAAEPVDPPKIFPVLKPEEVPAGDLADLLVRLRDSAGSGVRTAGVDPLPHQVAVLDRAFDRWPRGHLYADEVGLGKTIEIGLTVREALVRGWAERALLLVPAAVINQWQEELAEKLALWVPRWAGPNVGWVWPDHTRSDPADGDPWGAQYPVTLVSSHLARMRRNREALLLAPRWDIVAVDEAHHGRRSGGAVDGPPNLLLSLLQDMRREGSWETLLLATATPMQMHPHELWDLIELFDLPQGWDIEAKYEKYYDEVRRDEFNTRQWRFLGDMAHAHRTDQAGGRIDPVLEDEIRVQVASGRLAIKNFGKREVQQGWAAGIPAENRPWVDAWLLTNNPMRDRLFRNTRTTLRAYRDAGVMTATIPDREVDDEFLEMTDEERAVYSRIRDYIKAHYNAAMSAGGSRKGLGFIMTIYRRRLTSSFLAIRRSLQRRLDVLEGRLTAQQLLADDDLTLFDDEPTLDWNATRASLLDGEIDELRSFIEAIDKLPHPETKLGCLIERINRSFNEGHRTVLVFSQYADTVDLLADQLNGRWPGQVLAYTGAGGRLFDPVEQQWEGVGKADAKNLFRAGDDVKILVGTDTLAEGLNLQTCGRLVNYDMPWNFTRVEQRIGRVDRIGGHETVEVTNLFYNRTVEATIYRTLAEGFGGFNFIVGDAQPVLGDIEAAIQQAAFSDEEDDEHKGLSGTGSHDTLFSVSANLVGEIRAKINQSQAEAVRLQDLDDRADASTVADAFPDAVTLAEIEAVLLADPKVTEQLTAHPHINGVWQLSDEVGFTRAVTFDRAVLDEHSPDVRLLSPGDPLFDLVVRRASAPAVGANDVRSE